MAIEKKEFEVAEEEAKNAESNLIITLKKPVTYNGKTYSTLEFDFENLTGEDALNIEDELASIGKITVAPVFSGEYLIRMAAKACSEPVGSDLFRIIPIGDYNRIRSAARSFLLKSEA